MSSKILSEAKHFVKRSSDHIEKTHVSCEAGEKMRAGKKPAPTSARGFFQLKQVLKG
jgi:hypothetical protein